MTQSTLNTQNKQPFKKMFVGNVHTIMLASGLANQTRLDWLCTINQQCVRNRSGILDSSASFTTKVRRLRLPIPWQLHHMWLAQFSWDYSFWVIHKPFLTQG